MKYESELIHEILEQRGHDKSSLHYESECIESWIEEVKGAYPKLCDYQSEWLEYISILDDTGGGEDPEPPIGPDPEPPIGEFPYVVLSDVTEAAIDNVVPYAYKSAILKGKTDENLQSVRMPVLKTTGKNLFNGVSYIDGIITTANDYVVSRDTDVVSILINVNKDTNYTLSAKTAFDRSVIGGSLEPISIGTKTTNLNAERTSNTIKFNSGEYTNVIIYLNSSKIDIEDIQVEEGTVATTYQPYKSIILTVNEDVTLREFGGVQDTLD